MTDMNSDHAPNATQISPLRAAHLPHLAPRETLTPCIASDPTEVRSDEAGNLAGTVSALTEFLSLTGSHCEAPPIARFCRADGDGSTAVDGLR
ncbi:hypothetical protein GCM10010304_68470 [Streptomyces roseoviolaceus]